MGSIKGREMKKVVSGILLIYIMVGMLTLTFDVQPAEARWRGNVYIRADGSVYPASAPIQRNGDYYTLTDNIVSYPPYVLTVERDNIILDGANYTLTPEHPMGTTPPPKGILLSYRFHVTIKNTKISGGYVGITLSCSNMNNITNCELDGPWGGIELLYSSDNCISENNINSRRHRLLRGILEQ